MTLFSLSRGCLEAREESASPGVGIAKWSSFNPAASSSATKLTSLFPLRRFAVTCLTIARTSHLVAGRSTDDVVVCCDAILACDSRPVEDVIIIVDPAMRRRQRNHRSRLEIDPPLVDLSMQSLTELR